MKDGQTSSYWSDWGIEAIGADTSEDGVVIYTYPGGWKRRVKANRPVRNNNPGGLKFSSDEKAREAGALGRDEKGFGVFPDWMTGRRAADNLWDSYRTQKLTIREAAQKYTETEQEKRIKDLADKAKGWKDRDGNPDTQNTPLPKLTDEQFTILRDYNNIQLEGWLNGLKEFFTKPEHVASEWIQTPAGTQKGGGMRQPPARRAPASPAPTHPRSSLEAPQSPVHAASFPMDTPSGVQLTEPWNKLLAYDPSQGFPLPPDDPLARYEGGRFPSPFPSPVKDTTVSRLDDLLRPNLLTSPPQSGFFSSGTGNPPQTIARPSGPPNTRPEAPVTRAAQPPFYSAKDQLDFLGRVYRVAKPLSEATGLSLPFILAHAAHEVDFGKSIEGNNLFNLKADKDWDRPTHTRGDIAYRSYPSYEASMEDYLSHLETIPDTRRCSSLTRGRV